MTPTLPEIGQTVIVQLPDELTRGTILEVLKPDEVILTLDQPMVLKGGEYRQSDQVHARRSDAPLSGYWWTATRKVG